MDNNLNIGLYQNTGNYILGFHGCDIVVANEVLNDTTKHLKPSKNEYDWLGSGIYFWLNDPKRGLEWARETQRRKPKLIKEPSCVGAVIDLGKCLNLNERIGIELLKKSYDDLVASAEKAGMKFILENEKPDENGITICRPLDCAVINHLHDMLKSQGIEFDSVISYFQEGDNAYSGSEFRVKSHIQVCIRNTRCIKGYFKPREDTL